MRTLVITPTYNERENPELLAEAVLSQPGELEYLIVDDNSPDGTGELADQIAAREPRFQVLHRAGKLGLGSAYREAFASCDVVISSGGASDGDEDHTQAALNSVCAELVFWRLAMKPGRPMAVGSLGNKRLFCLPGNPVAAFVCYRLAAAAVARRALLRRFAFVAWAS